MVSLPKVIKKGFVTARSATSWSLCAVNTAAFASTATLITPFDPGGFRAYEVGRAWSAFNMWCIRSPIHTTGTDRIQPKTPYVVMSNHQSHLDVWTLFVGLPTQVRWVMKQELRRIPFFGKACESMGQIYVRRGNSDSARKSMDVAAERIATGTSVVFFPEGTRSEDGHLGRFKKGGFHLAIAAQVPVLPVSIFGTARILPPKSWRYTPGPVHMVIGEPIPTAGLTTAELPELMAKTRQAIDEGLATAKTHAGILSTPVARDSTFATRDAVKSAGQPGGEPITPPSAP